MSFLDNLEQNLKNLESADEAADTARAQRARRETREMERAAEPYAEELKKGPYGQEVLKEAARAGHAAKTKIFVAWIGQALRLELGARRLELRPTPAGISAVFIENNVETNIRPVRLTENPGKMIKEWLLLPPAEA